MPQAFILLRCSFCRQENWATRYRVDVIFILSCDGSVQKFDVGIGRTRKFFFLFKAGEWATSNQGVGLWIQLNFAEAYQIYRVKMMNRHGTGSKNRVVRLEFSDGSSETVSFCPRDSGHVILHEVYRNHEYCISKKFAKNNDSD